MSSARFSLAWIAAALLATALQAAPPQKVEDKLLKIDAAFDRPSAKPGDIVTWRLTIQVIPHWHTYPTQQTDPKASSYVTRFSWPKNDSLEPQGAIGEPANPIKSAIPEEEIKELVYFEGSVVWEQKFRVTEAAVNGEIEFAPKVRLTVCDEKRCVPGSITPTAKLTITGGKQAPAPAPVAPETTPPQPTAEEVKSSTAVAGDYRSQLESILSQIKKLNAQPHSGLWAFILTAMFWGGVSLLTPCVFPMIPITVSFFLKQSEKEHLNPILLATVYCVTIIVVLGTASLTLLGFFTKLAINPVMNLFIGLLFVTLALSLFGMYDLTLPNFLTRFTSSREGRGGIVGTVFMALTFTVVSFTCVAPFLGGFAGMAASGQFTKFELSLGAFAFAATFAAPFFLLAIFPSLIRRLPKSGGWLHTVKVVMGFVELAAAIKFFRTAELVRFSQANLFTYDLVLGMWVVLALLCGLYLFKLIHIGHHAEEETAVSAGRFITGFAFLSFAVLLLPALFSNGTDGSNQRPRGAIFAWVDAFLLPDTVESRESEMQWTGDLGKALADARKDRKTTGQPSFVFVDFTGKTCSVCKLNERDVLSRSDIRQLLQKYHRVQLYTDTVPDQFYPAALRGQPDSIERQVSDAENNRWFQEMAFGDIRLPLYAILEPNDNDIRVVGVYTEGQINNVAAFANFLRKPLTPQTTLAER